jgi:hypothetical protein
VSKIVRSRGGSPTPRYPGAVLETPAVAVQKKFTWAVDSRGLARRLGEQEGSYDPELDKEKA